MGSSAGIEALRERRVFSLMKLVRSRLRLRLVAVVVAAACATVLFRFWGAQMDLLSASIIGALPVGLAARFFGPRAAIVTLAAEILGNVDLMIGSEQGD